MTRHLIMFALDVLYKRLILGEPRRTLPRDDPEQLNRRLVPIKPEDKQPPR